jgi:hypothetical protein
MLSLQGTFQRHADGDKFRLLRALGRGGVVEAVLEGG